MESAFAAAGRRSGDMTAAAPAPWIAVRREGALDMSGENAAAEPMATRATIR